MRTGRSASPDSKAIIVDGFRFYPTKQGYYAGSVGKKQIKRLHIYLWEKHYGKVPKGYHVHHKDGDKTNNSIDNLELLTAYQHLHYHAQDPAAIATKRRSIEVARVAASEWHGSEAGREWHKKHWQETTKPLIDKRVTLICTVCGKEYEASAICAYRSKYCSGTCKATALRRRRGIPIAPFKQREQRKAESL